RPLGLMAPTAELLAQEVAKGPPQPRLQTELGVEGQQTGDPPPGEALGPVEVRAETFEGAGLPTEHEHLDAVGTLGHLVTEGVILFHGLLRPLPGTFEVALEEGPGVGQAAVDLTEVGLAGGPYRAAGILDGLLHLLGAAGEVADCGREVGRRPQRLVV